LPTSTSSGRTARKSPPLRRSRRGVFCGGRCVLSTGTCGFPSLQAECPIILCANVPAAIEFRCRSASVRRKLHIQMVRNPGMSNE
jgi:hypothetical protein